MSPVAVASMLLKWASNQQIRSPHIADDPYVAGVVSAKLRCHLHFLATSWVLRPGHATTIYAPGEARRLFLAGVQFAPQCSWDDVGEELLGMYEFRPARFAAYLRFAVPGDRDAIMDAIEAATMTRHIPRAAKAFWATQYDN